MVGEEETGIYKEHGSLGNQLLLKISLTKSRAPLSSTTPGLLNHHHITNKAAL